MLGKSVPFFKPQVLIFKGDGFVRSNFWGVHGGWGYGLNLFICFYCKIYMTWNLMISKIFTTLGFCEVPFGNCEVGVCAWNGGFIRSLRSVTLAHQALSYIELGHRLHPIVLLRTRIQEVTLCRVCMLLCWFRLYVLITFPFHVSQ